MDLFLLIFQNLILFNLTKGVPILASQMNEHKMQLKNVVAGNGIKTSTATYDEQMQK